MEQNVCFCVLKNGSHIADGMVYLQNWLVVSIVICYLLKNVVLLVILFNINKRAGNIIYFSNGSSLKSLSLHPTN